MKMKSPFATQGKNTHTLAVHCSGILACIAKSPTLEHRTRQRSGHANTSMYTVFTHVWASQNDKGIL